MSLVMAQDVPTSSTMALPHGPASVSTARRRLRRELRDREVPDPVVDDAVLILSELLSNACRHARPLAPLLDLDSSALDNSALDNPVLNNSAQGNPAQGNPAGAVPVRGDDAEDVGGVLVRWLVQSDGLLTLEVVDGGAPTRPRSARPSLTARGGRGLSIVGRLAADWGVRDDAPGEVTVWAVLPVRARHARRGGPTVTPLSPADRKPADRIA
ncbi:ATP-binding protein [Streptomyces sp. NPDC092296]|uniref:ATP-binding protein n=1 Tax=Streptomyces sp. NPDC092296 TaxID=3366012 RepID=UPI0038158042